MKTAGQAGARGFTLIELIFAIMLLAVGLLALVGALTRALQESQAARSKLAALRYLETVADSLIMANATGEGRTVRPGVSLEWRREPCAAGACVRATAVIGAGSDTLEVLAAIGHVAPR